MNPFPAKTLWLHFLLYFFPRSVKADNPPWGQTEVISLSLLKYNLQYARPKQVLA